MAIHAIALALFPVPFAILAICTLPFAVFAVSFAVGTRTFTVLAIRGLSLFYFGGWSFWLVLRLAEH